MKEKINLLEVIPYPDERIKVIREGDSITLGIPRFKREWMRRYLLPKSMSPYIHVSLEENGTVVWNLIDGRRTVRDIIEELAGYFEGQEGYEARVATYIVQLRKDRFIKYQL